MSEFFCPLPWIHQFIQPDGIRMCCSSSIKLDVSPAEFNNSKQLNKVKDTIRAGKIPKECKNCSSQESQGYTSTRTLALKDWNYTIDTVPNRPLYLDIRWSNLCNFSCRTCEPAFSSEISREQQSFPIHKFNKLAKSDILNMLNNVVRINFTGGEPLLIKENIEILKYLIDNNQTNCELLITTNASVINDYIINLIKQFDCVHWTISIDAVSHSAEYIRNGTVWTNVNNNIHTILNLKQSVALNCVLSAYSILAIDNLVCYFSELKTQHTDQPLELWFSMCDKPEMFRPIALPTHLKKHAMSQLEKAITRLSTIANNPNRSIDMIKALHNNLNDSIINTVLSDDFIQYTQELDQLRDQNFNTIFGVSLDGQT